MIKRLYQEVVFEIVVVDDAVCCSQWGFGGDDGDDDIFEDGQGE